jgi:hypothetical protein
MIGVRLQRHKTRRVKGKDYFRWMVVIPPKSVEELGWKEGMELETRMKKGRLVLRRAKSKM